VAETAGRWKSDKLGAYISLSIAKSQKKKAIIEHI